ncbi:hypothetical protein MMPV_005173 [Pyropia vietnamensis]
MTCGACGDGAVALRSTVASVRAAFAPVLLHPGGKAAARVVDPHRRRRRCAVTVTDDLRARRSPFPVAVATSPRVPLMRSPSGVDGSSGAWAAAALTASTATPGGHRVSSSSQSSSVTRRVTPRAEQTAGAVAAATASPARTLASLSDLTAALSGLLHVEHLRAAPAAVKDAPLGHLGAATHVAVVFGKRLRNGRVSVEYAKRLATLAKALACGTLSPDVLCFTGAARPEPGMPSPPPTVVSVPDKGSGGVVPLSEAAAGYVYFRGLCEELGVDMSGYDVILDESSSAAITCTRDNLSGVLAEMARRHGHGASSRCHLTLVSSDYHLIRLQDEHRLSPSASALSPLEVSGASWTYLFAAYPFCVSRDATTAALGRITVLASDLSVVLSNLDAVLSHRRFMAPENVHRLSDTLLRLRELSHATMAIGRRGRRAETLDAVVMSLRSVQNYLAPLRTPGVSPSRRDMSDARDLLAEAIGRLRSELDPDMSLDAASARQLLAEARAAMDVASSSTSETPCGCLDGTTQSSSSDQNGINVEESHLPSSLTARVIDCEMQHGRRMTLPSSELFSRSLGGIATAAAAAAARLPLPTVPSAGVGPPRPLSGAGRPPVTSHRRSLAAPAAEAARTRAKTTRKTTAPRKPRVRRTVTAGGRRKAAGSAFDAPSWHGGGRGDGGSGSDGGSVGPSAACVNALLDSNQEVPTLLDELLPAAVRRLFFALRALQLPFTDLLVAGSRTVASLVGDHAPAAGADSVLAPSRPVSAGEDPFQLLYVIPEVWSVKAIQQALPRGVNDLWVMVIMLLAVAPAPLVEVHEGGLCSDRLGTIAGHGASNRERFAATVTSMGVLLQIP